MICPFTTCVNNPPDLLSVLVAMILSRDIFHGGLRLRWDPPALVYRGHVYVRCEIKGFVNRFLTKP
jgi:hypothetical protein